MTDDSTPPRFGRVSLAKTLRGTPRAGTGAAPAAGPSDGTPPKTVRQAVAALTVTAIAALVTALALQGLKGWLYDNYRTTNDKLKPTDKDYSKNHKTTAQLHQLADKAAHTQIVVTIVLIIALAVVARGALRGRHWARWAVIGVWVLATFTQTVAGFFNVIGIASSAPLAYKIPAFVSAVSLVVAVVMVSLKPSAQFFALSRPAGKAAARRGGLFGPRPAAGTRTRPATPVTEPPVARNDATTRPAGDSASSDGPQRARSKQRADASTARGADLARARAKASKSRRTQV